MLGKNKKKNAQKGNGNGTFERKDMSGSLFENDRKTSDNHPDMTGVVKIDGVELRVAGWVKERSDGSEWISLSFSEFQNPNDAPAGKSNSSKKVSSKKKYEEEVDDEDDADTDDDSGDDDDDAEEEDLTPPKRRSSKTAVKQAK